MQRKRRKKKRFGVFLFLLVVCIGIGIMFVPWAMQPENFREVKNKINGFLYKEDFPDSYNAKSLILVDCSDDEIFVSKKENEPQIPASLAKDVYKRQGRRALRCLMLWKAKIRERLFR